MHQNQTEVSSSPTGQDVWDRVWGQDDAVALLQRAALDASTMTHAWLITGPPGSGRSTLAYAFAAELIAHDPDEHQVKQQVIARTHPDLLALRTEGVVITIKDARMLVERSYLSPSSGRYRVIVVEDADRMPERTSNVLLKALEEPPERTIWILCAPSDADLLPTIRSRVRTLRLREPTVTDVARLVEARTGVSEQLAEQSARLAQRHIGMAQRLATDEASRLRREQTLRAVLGVRSIADVVTAAADIMQAANDDAKALTEERDTSERESFLRTIGVAAGGKVPPALRAQLSALEDEQKRRATRSVRDGIDRVLTDMQSMFRDMLMVKFGRDDQLINQELAAEIRQRCAEWAPERMIDILDQITVTRENVEQNAAPLLAMESLLITVGTGMRP